MPDNCDTSTCCDEILDEFQRVCEETEATMEDSWANLRPVFDIINGHQGAFINTPAGYLPTLAETTGRVNNFGAGFDEWGFFEFRTDVARVAVNLPASIADPSKAAVSLNAARLSSPRDYTISGAVLTLAYPLEYRDWLVVKTYGA